MKNECIYGLGELVEVYAQLRHVLGKHVLCGANEGLAKEIACNAFLREVYEAEVRDHGGLCDEKIKQYNEICQAFLWPKHLD